jgi:hypothetical protein
MKLISTKQKPGTRLSVEPCKISIEHTMDKESIKIEDLTKYRNTDNTKVLVPKFVLDKLDTCTNDEGIDKVITVILGSRLDGLCKAKSIALAEAKRRILNYERDSNEDIQSSVDGQSTDSQ